MEEQFTRTITLNDTEWVKLLISVGVEIKHLEKSLQTLKGYGLEEELEAFKSIQTKLRGF